MILRHRFMLRTECLLWSYSSPYHSPISQLFILQQTSLIDLPSAAAETWTTSMPTRHTSDSCTSSFRRRRRGGAAWRGVPARFADRGPGSSVRRPGVFFFLPGLSAQDHGLVKKNVLSPRTTRATMFEVRARILIV